MIAIWYGIVSLMLAIYVVLDGRNFGAGMRHWLVARSPGERRQVIAAIGPLWSWHEVWLVGFGGTLIGFAGMYFVLGVLFLVLMGREIGHGPDAEVGPPAEPRP